MIITILSPLLVIRFRPNGTSPLVHTSSYAYVLKLSAAARAARHELLLGGRGVGGKVDLERVFVAGQRLLHDAFHVDLERQTLHARRGRSVPLDT